MYPQRFGLGGIVVAGVILGLTAIAGTVMVVWDLVVREHYYEETGLIGPQLVKGLGADAQLLAVSVRPHIVTVSSVDPADEQAMFNWELRVSMLHDEPFHPATTPVGTRRGYYKVLGTASTINFDVLPRIAQDAQQRLGEGEEIKSIDLSRDPTLLWWVRKQWEDGDRHREASFGTYGADGTFVSVVEP